MMAKKWLAVASLSLSMLVVGGLFQNFSPSELVPGKNLNLKMSNHGEERTFVLHVPASYAASAKIPLIIALHPSNADGAGMERITGFDAVSDKEEFFVAYPDSSEKAKPKKTWITKDTKEDVFFTVALSEYLADNFPVDPDKIYVAGFSDGGGLAQQLACDATDAFAGVAIVAANLNPNTMPACKPSRPIKLIHFHGTADPIVPYAGGTSDGPNGKPHTDYSAMETVEFWAKANTCPSGNILTQGIPDVLVNDGADPTTSKPVVDTMQAWQDCKTGTTVSLYSITGGGHTWPGGASTGKWGDSSKNLNASQVIWDTLKDTSETPGPVDITAKKHYHWKAMNKQINAPNRKTPRIYGIKYCGTEKPKKCQASGDRCFVWKGIQWNNWIEQNEFNQYRCVED